MSNFIGSTGDLAVIFEPIGATTKTADVGFIDATSGLDISNTYMSINDPSCNGTAQAICNLRDGAADLTTVFCLLGDVAPLSTAVWPGGNASSSGFAVGSTITAEYKFLSDGTTVKVLNVGANISQNDYASDAPATIGSDFELVVTSFILDNTSTSAADTNVTGTITGTGTYNLGAIQNTVLQNTNAPNNPVNPTKFVTITITGYVRRVGDAAGTSQTLTISLGRTV